jgi:hypothetical protein
LPSSGLVDQNAANRVRPVRLLAQFGPSLSQPLLQPIGFNGLKAHSVHSRCSPVFSGKPIGVGENVLSVHLVVEQVEAETWLVLRLYVKLPLERPDLFGSFQAHANLLLLGFIESTPK